MQFLNFPVWVSGNQQDLQLHRLIKKIVQKNAKSHGFARASPSLQPLRQAIDW